MSEWRIRETSHSKLEGRILPERATGGWRAKNQAEETQPAGGASEPVEGAGKPNSSNQNNKDRLRGAVAARRVRSIASSITTNRPEAATFRGHSP